MEGQKEGKKETKEEERGRQEVIMTNLTNLKSTRKAKYEGLH